VSAVVDDDHDGGELAAAVDHNNDDDDVDVDVDGRWWFDVAASDRQAVFSAFIVGVAPVWEAAVREGVGIGAERVRFGVGVRRVAFAVECFEAAVLGWGAVVVESDVFVGVAGGGAVGGSEFFY
jgi:hypothetical protein